MTASQEKSYRKLAANRKGVRDYFVLERYEAGIALYGTEVKSARDGHISLSGGFARVENGRVVLYNINISPYEYGNRSNHEADRPRQLLFHKAEIKRLQAQTEQKGCALIPLSVHLRRGLVKVELGLCKGKTHRDKREVLRRKVAEREADRAISRRFRK